MPKRKKSQSKDIPSKQAAFMQRIIFLGTASMAPIPLRRNVSSMVIVTSTGNNYMIDCGEGTQHQLKLSVLRTGKLHSIFLTHLHGDHCYGIFGLLHALKAGDRTLPLHVYGPIGTQQMIMTALFHSGGWKGFQIIIHELSIPIPQISTEDNKDEIDRSDVASAPAAADDGVTDDVTEEKSSPVPPSIANEADTTDATDANEAESNVAKKEEISEEKSEKQSQHSQISFDTIDNPQNKGDIRYTTDQIIDLGEIEAGIKCYACPITHRVDTFGYVFIESDKLGKLDAAKAMSMGAVGRQLGTLKNGTDVVTNDGRVIKSSDVVGSSTPGRKIAIMQDCSYCDSAFDIAANCDVLIHEATFDEEHFENAIKFGHSTAKMAAQNAIAMRARLLLLTHFSGRFVESTSEMTGKYGPSALDCSNHNYSLDSQPFDGSNAMELDRNSDSESSMLRQRKDSGDVTMMDGDTLTNDNTDATAAMTQHPMTSAMAPTDDGGGGGDDDDLSLIAVLQNEAEDVLQSYYNELNQESPTQILPREFERLIRVRCACDFMTIERKNNDYVVSPQLAVRPRRIGHFEENVSYIEKVMAYENHTQLLKKSNNNADSSSNPL